MRVCPNCGYHDLPIWRNSRFYFNVDVAKTSDLEFWGLDSLIENLKRAPENFYEDGHFAYLLQAGGTIVLRKEVELLNKDIEGAESTCKKERWFTIRVEKARQKSNLSQKKIGEF